uniref:HPS5-like beta-propeller domain-containing protein n=1 Tax=Eptatretus burgeri TaxID=7764 RepID=A0A8C4QKJ7_EPTBU
MYNICFRRLLDNGSTKWELRARLRHLKVMEKSVIDGAQVARDVLVDEGVGGSPVVRRSANIEEVKGTAEYTGGVRAEFFSAGPAEKAECRKEGDGIVEGCRVQVSDEQSDDGEGDFGDHDAACDKIVGSWPGSHVLLEVQSLNSLLRTLRLDTGRLKCTAVALCRQSIALGTSASGVHLVSRETGNPHRFFSLQAGPVTHLSFCPHDENFIAVATRPGGVVVWRLSGGGAPVKAKIAGDKSAMEVTTLVWDHLRHRLFVGDLTGTVCCLVIQGKGCTARSTVYLDSRIVQMDHHGSLLLACTLHAAYLLQTDSDQIQAIGSKPRNGHHGGCLLSNNAAEVKVMCSRPGSRMWEADESGRVLRTHQMKCLFDGPATPILTERHEPKFDGSVRRSSPPPFQKLLPVGRRDVIAWSDGDLFVLRPASSRLLLWTRVSGLLALATWCDHLVLLSRDPRLSLSLLCVLPAERAFARLMSLHLPRHAAQIALNFPHQISPAQARKYVPSSTVTQLIDQLHTLDCGQQACEDGEEVENHYTGWMSNDDLASRLQGMMGSLEDVCSSHRSSLSSEDNLVHTFPGTFQLDMKQLETSLLATDSSWIEESALGPFQHTAETPIVEDKEMASEAKSNREQGVERKNYRLEGLAGNGQTDGGEECRGNEFEVDWEVSGNGIEEHQMGLRDNGCIRPSHSPTEEQVQHRLDNGSVHYSHLGTQISGRSGGAATVVDGGEILDRRLSFLLELCERRQRHLLRKMVEDCHRYFLTNGSNII